MTVSNTLTEENNSHINSTSKYNTTTQQHNNKNHKQQKHRKCNFFINIISHPHNIILSSFYDCG